VERGILFRCSAFGNISLADWNRFWEFPQRNLSVRRNRGAASRYNQAMARGWESKSVEAQQADAGEKSAASRTRLTAEEAVRQRNKEGLLLARKRVLAQMEASKNPRHREMMETSLNELDRQLSQLES
jgi:hypothetical protein